ncbi:hypothetical protein [Streptomyces catenulae]|uniref:Uncharacterized protein n=1 Tax=Streptomyces catenulae TaxID=66875 RepID=A0ABV2Z6L7_9ACTN|nr:hypothetical protein [Streptomyces catenulae]
MAAEQARSMDDGPERRTLLEALLRGPYRDSAPEWLLKAAVDSDLARKPPQSDPLYGPAMDLALSALSHPSCTPELRYQSLRQCTAAQLGLLGSPQAGDVLADAIAHALHEREPHRQSMTVGLLDAPSDAQLVLRQHRLHTTVITAALELLPSYPSFDKSEGEDTSAWLERHKAAEQAWRTVWKRVVTTHPEHHRLLVTWSDDNDAGYIVREHLLGGIPWDVEPELLEEIALDDLASFPDSVLTTRMCRMRREGATEQEVREHFASDLAELSPQDREHIDYYLSDSTYRLRFGCRAAISHTAWAAERRWRHLLNPDQAQQYGRPHPWRATADQLASLARQFAEQAAVVLALWEPDPDSPINSAKDLRWVCDLLKHLPVVTPDVTEQVRLICRDAKRGLAGRREYGRYELASDVQQARELLDTIERMIAGPMPDPGSVRTASLGAPEHVTVRDLAGAPDTVFAEFVRRHQGDDSLVEKALLSFASRTYRREVSFADVLHHHSAPQHALLNLTQNLRRHLGGGPNLRTAWADAVLGLPTTSTEVIRALPAWTALKASGPRGQAAHPAVTSVVCASLGDSTKAWQRFAASPAGNVGPTAWLRLGDLLDAATKGTSWPKPPYK